MVHGGGWSDRVGGGERADVIVTSAQCDQPTNTYHGQKKAPGPYIIYVPVTVIALILVLGVF